MQHRDTHSFFFSTFMMANSSLWAACDPNGDISGANTATITLDTAGCATASADTATIESTATITATGDGVYGPNNAWTVTNQGTITVTGQGINLQNGGAVTNEATGIISGAAAIGSIPNAAVTVVNSGSLSGSNYGTFLLGGGSVTNYQGATITGSFDGICFSTNGITPGTGTGYVENSGTITSVPGAYGDGITFGLSGTLLNNATGLIDGFQGVTGVGGQPYNIDIQNYGQIGTFANASTGVGLGGGGTVINYEGGQILAGSRGISSDVGVGTIINAGTIIANGARGISMSAGGSVTNSATGIISGGSRGIHIEGGIGTVNNAGSITGSTAYAFGAYNAIESLFSNSIVTNTGTIYSNVQFFGGQDVFLMTAGTFTGQLLMATVGNETATFQNVTDANTSAISLIDGGGGGNDILYFDNAHHTGGSEMTDWETIRLIDSSILTLSSNLVLGGVSADQTATLAIQNATLQAGNGVQPLVSSLNRPAQVNNAGIIDLTNGIDITNNTLTIVGNYASTGGMLTLDTVLNGDGSPSDKLILDGTYGATVTGTTAVTVINVGGVGAQTVEGILVVEALNGATTGPSETQLNPAFVLANALRPNAFDYRLFKGYAGFTQNWYLRSTFGADNSPVIGPELSVYATPHVLIKDMNILMIGTLHQRVGDEADLQGNDFNKQSVLNGFWVRTFGEHHDSHVSSMAAPHIEGSLLGFQTGVDLLRQETVSGQRNIVGVYTSYANSHNTMSGLVTNEQATANIEQYTGNVDLYSWAGGGYWTHFGRSGWYLDVVGQYARSFSNLNSTRTGIDPDGRSVTGSVEAGYPFSVTDTIIVEPQAQFIYVHSRHDPIEDAFCSVSLGSSHSTVGRLGVLAQLNATDRRNYHWRPYVIANIWRHFNASATMNFADTQDITSDYGDTWSAEAGAGMTVRVKDHLSLYTEASYNHSFADNQQTYWSAVKGDLGVRLNW